jgi:hypothetical protein
MNVRFFAGTRWQYDSLPTPHNPLGLYFCEDTNELFWGDRLLTDGMRVVEKFADLPEPTKAADGVVYYVTETRNGYVVPHGTTKWLQTIYAPALDVTKVPESEIYNTVTTVGAVRDLAAEIYGEISDLDERIADIEVGTSGSGVTSIYFAGRKLDAHDDGSYHIDRFCALEALGFVVPDGISENTKLEFVTKEYVDTLIKNVTGVDFSEYAKKTDLTGFASEHFVRAQMETIPEVYLGDYAKKSDIPEVDLSIYAKKSDIPSIEGLASVDFVNQKIAGLSKDVDLSNYYTKAEVDARIPAIDNFITRDEIPSIDSLATISYVDEKLAGIVLPKIPTKISEFENDVGYITSIEGLATEDFVRSEIAKAELRGGVTEEALANIIANYYNKTEIDTLVSEAVNGIEIPDTSNFITMEDVESKGYLTEHQNIEHLATKKELQEALDNINHPTVDLTGYATEAYVKNAIAEAELNDKEVDLTGYATKEDLEAVEAKIPSLDGYAKLEDIPEAELYTVDFNAPSYSDAVEAYYAGKVLVLTNAAPDVNSFAVMNYVSDQYITFTKFLMSRSEAYGAFNTYYLKSDNTWEVVKEVRLNKVEASVDDNGVTTLNIGKDSYKLDYITNEYIQNQNYVTTNYIEQNYTTTEQLEATYVTQENVTEVVTQQIETTVTEQIESKVTEVIETKIENGTIATRAESISYDTF